MPLIVYNMSKEEIGLNGNIDHNKLIRTAKRATIASYGLSGIILMGAALNELGYSIS
jgi:hypothetical protein